MRSGMSLRDLERTAYGRGLALSRATAGRIESGTFPKQYQLRAYLVACEVGEAAGPVWEEAWRRLAHRYPHGRKVVRQMPLGSTPDVPAKLTSGPSEPVSTIDTANAVELLEAAVRRVRGLEKFVKSGDSTGLPDHPRMSLSVEIRQLDHNYVSVALATRVRFGRSLTKPTYHVFSSAEDVPYGVGDVAAQELLFEWWNAEDGLFDDFAETVRDTAEFRVGQLRSGGVLRTVGKGAMREMSEAEVLARLPGVREPGVAPAVRGLEVELAQLADGQVLDVIDTVEMRVTTIYRDEPINYFYWTPAGAAYLESVHVRVIGLPADSELVRVLHMPVNSLRHGERVKGPEFTVDPRTWIAPGHGITVVWRSTNR
jgi:hypothetical protein